MLSKEKVYIHISTQVLAALIIAKKDQLNLSNSPENLAIEARKYTTELMRQLDAGKWPHEKLANDLA